MESDFDAIVIGSGAGGASFAHVCADARKSVLVIERGSRPDLRKETHNERNTLIDKRPYDNRLIEIDGSPRQLYMGGVTGGSMALYGGVLLRPSSDDFTPGKHYSQFLPKKQWEWPIGYDDLQAHYEEAENLLSVSALAKDDFSPLHAPKNIGNDSILPLAPINDRLIRSNRNHGLRPFRLPLAIDRQRCTSCPECAGYLCPHEARPSMFQLIAKTEMSTYVHVLTRTEVERLVVGKQGKIDYLVIRDLDTGTRRRLRGKIYALAAGAIGSAAILLRSEIGGDMVGRNYMMHYSPITVGVFPKPTGAHELFVKQIGFADFYFGTPQLPHKMGIVQSLPAPGPLMLAKSGLSWLPYCVRSFLRKRMLPLAGIVEDLPCQANRVLLQRDGTIRLQHAFSDFDRLRGRELGRQMGRILKRCGAYQTVSRAFPSQEHVAHQCGTIRFGSDPKHAIVDRNCRMFGYSNLFVADGSVFPTSLGVGPSLTIVANALRIARPAINEL